MGDPYSHSQSHSNPSELRFHTSNVEATDHNYEAGAGVCAYSGAGSNSARYKLMSPAKLPITRSTSITIPSGLSPTSFLESPVLLSNIKAEPSPTTGSFFKPHPMHGFGGSAAFLLSRNSSNSNPFDEQKSNGFEFRPHTGSNSVSGLSSAGPLDQCQFRPFVSLPLSNSEMLASKEFSNCAPVSMSASRVNMPVDVDSDDMNQGEHSNGNQAPQSDHKDTAPSVMTDKSSDDGYNWRKYGQKVVKGCEFPRSYYKCTHPNCEVKKIFERSRDGQIIDTVYKGIHDHPKPQPNRRFTAGALMSIQEEKTVKASSLPNQGDDYTAYTQTTTVDPSGTPLSSPRGANGDNADGASPVLNGTNDDVDEDDPFSKRRKTDVGGSIDLITAVVKPIREPRVVVQTLSEVDILDDGYRWRKYGQKVVRGNPNPRSYYKCTNAGCSVRKHVERAAHDPKAVITTYEGKHNHDVPMARANSHEVGGPMPVVNGMSRIIRSEDNDTISLDLGVGMTYGAENNNAGHEQHHQTLESKPVRSQVHDIINSNHKVIQASPIPTYYGVVNGGMNNLYGSRENRVESRNFEAPPLGHSSG